MTTANARVSSTTAVNHADQVVDLGAPFDLPRTLGVLQRGSGDPTIRLDTGTFSGGSGGTPGAGAWMCQRVYDVTGGSCHGADDQGLDQCPGDRPWERRSKNEHSRTIQDRKEHHGDKQGELNTGGAPGRGPRELGQVTYRFDQLDASRVRVRIAASNAPLAQTGVARAVDILGAQDDWQELEFLLDALGDHTSMALARVRRTHPGVRLPATGALFDQLVTVALEQKVTHQQARYSWRNLVRRHGECPPSSSAVPAPAWMRLPLSPEQLRGIPSWEWHRLWVQPPLSRTIQRLAERARTIHHLGLTTSADSFGVEDLAEQLTAIPGVGEWTAAEALQRSHGAADLPAVGDYHLAHFMGQALTGSRTDDAGMLELLDPYRPHRQRIVRLVKLSGFQQQRFGPRLTPEDHRAR